MNWEPKECRFGDMIRVRLGSVFHYGIFVDEQRIIQFGLPPIPKYRKPDSEIEVCVSDIDVFSCGSIVETAEYTKKEKKKKYSEKEIVRRAEESIGEGGYNLLHNNCEHFANYCVFGERRCSLEEDAMERWKTRPIFDIYIMKIDECSEKSENIAFLKKDILKAKDEKTRLGRIASRVLLKIAFERSLKLNADKTVFKKRLNGKPYCKEAFFSIARSADFAITIVSNKECGIDCLTESYPPARENPADEEEEKRKILCKGERTDLSLVSLLTKKECIYKFRSKGRFIPSATDTSAVPTRTFTVNPFGLTVSFCGEYMSHARFYTSNGKTAAFTDTKQLTELL